MRIGLPPGWIRIDAPEEKGDDEVRQLGSVEGPWQPRSSRRIDLRRDSPPSDAERTPHVDPQEEVDSSGEEEPLKNGELLSKPFPAQIRTKHPSWLEEFHDVRQRPEEGFRRYFSSNYFKLWVWYESDKKTLIGFQLLWGGDDKENAITWKKGYISHTQVADEGHAGAPKMAQILHLDAGKIRPSTIYIFRKYAAHIEQSLVDFIVSKVLESAKITQAMMDDVEQEYLGRKGLRK